MTSILIADDHELVRETIATFLRNAAGFEITQCADFSGALAKITANGPYDLVLVDYTMPGMSLPEGMNALIDANMPNPVAMLSGTASADVARRVLESGARGFLPKTMAPETLVSAVRHILAGDTYTPRQFLEADPANPDAPQLTPRERDVLRGLCDGKSNKEIARDLDLQEVTIKLHVKTLSRKLNARNRTHAAMLGRDMDLI
ncbi:response regulator transcription factor [Thalassobius vesicularis]|uniref:Response regulator transcription factor n=1 Tax=Thalassobius vesicularis TaxID=1294297 RepID=A0A4S3MB67_9RHOB|nr:response regulator transcription factor [Thalassobius vesicularis]THD75024.1 response regulator transcription factor [Thalassobius vesicularis]